MKNVVIMEKIKYRKERLWYINKTVENGWSRNVLVHQIITKLEKNIRFILYIYMAIIKYYSFINE